MKVIKIDNNRVEITKESKFEKTKLEIEVELARAKEEVTLLTNVLKEFE